MESNSIINENVIDILKHDAGVFLTNTRLEYQELVIWPKEIEVYYYKRDEFEDSSVHRNSLQMNNKNHFYVHRRRIGKNDKYKSGNRAGLDFVVSDSVNIYHSYLIRSAVIDERLLVGPNIVLKYLTEVRGYSYANLEVIPVNPVFSKCDGDVFFSNRINLGENAGIFKECALRAVLCDRWYRDSKYPLKEKMIVGFLLKQVKQMNMDSEWAMDYAKKNLGYIPSILRTI